MRDVRRYKRAMLALQWKGKGCRASRERRQGAGLPVEANELTGIVVINVYKRFFLFLDKKRVY